MSKASSSGSRPSKKPPTKASSPALTLKQASASPWSKCRTANATIPAVSNSRATRFGCPSPNTGASPALGFRSATNTPWRSKPSFPSPDHIGCVAISNGVIWGGNWDSRHFYRWRPDGTLIDKRPNPTGTGFQDLKLHDGSLIGNGVKTPTSGAIEWLHPESLTVQRSISTGRTDRNVRYSNEGMAIDKGILYLLPEDDPSRLFRFRLP